LTEAERSELFKLGSVQEANNWAAEKGRAWEQEQTRLAEEARQEAAKQEAARVEAKKVAASQTAFLDTGPAVVQKRVDDLINQYISNRSPEAKSQLEALGFELFDPDGPDYSDESGTYITQPERWLSPQEAASITGTKVNNLLRQEALAKTVSQMPGLTPLAKQLGMALDPDSTGGKLKNLPNFLEEVANRFTSKTGITDLNDLGERKLNITVIPANEASGEMYFNNDTGQMEKYPTQFYNKKTGQVIPYEAVQGLGTFGNQQDETGVSFTQKPDGTFAVKARYAYEQEPWKDVVTAVAPIAINFVPGAGQFLGAAILPAGTSAAVQTAVGNLVIKTGIDVAAGVPLDVALKNNFVSAGVNTFLPDLRHFYQI